MTDAPDCARCLNSYRADDGVRRCRPSQNGAPCSPLRASLCGQFDPVLAPPGDGSEPWFKDAWTCDCQGRGD